jgi:hypothetical protein
LGGKAILEALRNADLKVEPHSKWFRHNTPDEDWLPKVGEKKWIVLMRDIAIGKRVLELNALLRSKVKAFVLVTGELSEEVSADIIKKALPKIFELVEQNNFPFIAKIHKNSSVELWKTKIMVHKGIQLR